MSELITWKGHDCLELIHENEFVSLGVPLDLIYLESNGLSGQRD